MTHIAGYVTMVVMCCAVISVQECSTWGAATLKNLQTMRIMSGSVQCAR